MGCLNGASGMRGIRVETGMNDVMTAKDAADGLGINIATIYKYAKSGKLKAYRKYGKRHFYFMREDIEEFKANEGFVLYVPDNAPTGEELGLKKFKGKSLTTKDVARFLCVSERWVQSRIKDQTFPIKCFSVKTRDRVFDSADVDKYLSVIMMSAGNAELPLKAVKKILSKEVAVE
jgi:excisionase family DNA binding protein